MSGWCTCTAMKSVQVRRTVTLAVSILLSCLLKSSCQQLPGPPTPPAGPPPIPYARQVGGWLGVTVDYLGMDVDDYAAKAGIAPAAYNVFVTLPLDDNSTIILTKALPKLAKQKALIMLTIEPTQGLHKVTYAVIGALGFYVHQAQLQGASFMVSFGHEMNGNWYAWGQQPLAYVDAFQKVRRTLNTVTCGVAMVWAPNPARGYPWRNGTGNATYGAPVGSPDWALMDTNEDGQVNWDDDPLTPYWPGDENVSWVGTAAYSWGSAQAPYIVNALPEARQFTTMVTGYGNDLSNVYGRFSADGWHNKPMVITESSALFIPSISDGNTNLEIKSAWWQQALNGNANTDNALNLQQYFPQIKMVMWFDVAKPEPSAAGKVVDWRFSGDEDVSSAFVTFVTSQYAADGAQYWGDLNAFKKSGLAAVCKS